MASNPKKTAPTRLLPALAILAPFVAVAAPDRTIDNPAELAIQRPAFTWMEPGVGGLPEVRTGTGHTALLNLDIVYSDPAVTRIYNPSTVTYDKVRLRTYNGHLVAPTIRVHPGETVRATLTNKLPAQHCGPTGNINQPDPGCFNLTNLHAHGVWVSPTGNSDNVLLTIPPGSKFEYEYNIPSDHPSGIYWYHPHVHGSTALQVAGGMAGALIVAGDRPPTADAPGDIDVLLKDRHGRPFTERVVLVQQIQYACRDADNQIKKKTDADGHVIAWVCDQGDVGTIEGYDQFGPPTWQESNRFTTLNGEVQPVFADAQAGRIERWRMVHAGVRDTVNVAFVKAKPGAQPIASGMGPAQQLWLRENCGDPAAKDPQDTALTQWELASDGQTHERILGLRTNVLQPGYRTDFLMMFPEPGLYCMIDRGANRDSVVNAQEKSDRLLAFVRVEGGTGPKQDVQRAIQKALTTAADRLPRETRADVKRDLADGLGISRFAPHRPVTDAEVMGYQSLTFSIGGTVPDNVKFMVDGKSFDPTDFSRTLTLGSVDEWTLSSANAFEDPTLKSLVISHPFHIHINPFQVTKVLDKEGRDLTDPSIARATRLAWEQGDPQYLDMRGMWRDTVFLKQDYKVIMRTRYERYIGDFVLHCHILDHEDQGMMQMVRIAMPGQQSAHTH